MVKKQILLLQDGPPKQECTEKRLRREGFEVKTVVSFVEAGTVISRKSPDAIILNIRRSNSRGLDFLRQLRQAVQTPVLMLTRCGASADIVLGFKAGCDDYLFEPYPFEVLLVRLEHLLKSAERVPEIITRGTLTLRPASMAAFRNNEDLLLSPKDYLLLQLFIQNENRPLPWDYIYRTVWGHSVDRTPKTLGVAVSRVRKKLGGSGYTISAVYGNGYQFERGEA